MDGGVDVLLLETIFDTLNAKAALFAIEKYFDETGRRVPVLASVTFVQVGNNARSPARRSKPFGTRCRTRRC